MTKTKQAELALLSAILGVVLAATLFTAACYKSAPKPEAELPRLEDAGPVVTFQQPLAEGE